MTRNAPFESTILSISGGDIVSTMLMDGDSMAVEEEGEKEDKDCADGVLTATITDFVLVHFTIHQITLLAFTAARKNAKMGRSQLNANAAQ